MTEPTREHWIIGSVATPTGPVPKVTPDWQQPDEMGRLRSRVSAFRMKYRVAPGIYAAGEPRGDAPVLVTANYKLSFDLVRRGLRGLNAWILVLDTAGINVWCAAGKGKFGSYELMKRIRLHGLEKLVDHRKVIVPQLGAPGIDAARVQRETGFRVHYGPVDAKDLPAYLASGLKATPEMRRVRFPLADRLVLTPMELVPALRPLALLSTGIVFATLLGTLGGHLLHRSPALQPKFWLFKTVFNEAGPLVALSLVAVISGAFLTPALLPFIPSRWFSIKGWLLGLICVFLATFGIPWLSPPNSLTAAFNFLLFPVLSSYLALQFTGSTPFTGMSGVKKEIHYILPVYKLALALSALLFASSLLRNLVAGGGPR